MFFAPALIVAAASAVSAAPLAMPAQQAVNQNLGLDLEDKDAYLLDIIQSLFGKRDLGSLENTDDDDKKALFDWLRKAAKWVVPVIKTVASGLGKRDLDHEVFARAIQDFDLENMDDDEKKALFGWLKKAAKWVVPVIKTVAAGLGKRDLDQQVLARAIQEFDLEDKDAFTLFEIIEKASDKRDLGSIENMNDDEKKAFWGTIISYGIPIIANVISGLGRKNKRNLYDLPTVPFAAKRSLEASFARRLAQDQGLLDALNDF